MSKVIIDVFGNPLTYRLCTLEDVDKHFRCVRRIVAPEEVEAYKERMRHCVKQKCAWCIENSNVFLYCLREDEYVVEGVSLSWVGRPVEWLALLTALMTIEDTEVIFVQFYLHDKTVVQHFRTLIDHATVKGNVAFPKKVVIRADYLRELFKFAGVT